MKKYFQFSGTISGTSYFLRNIFAFFISLPISNGIAVSATAENWIPVFILFLFYLPILWFSVATITKRVRAVFPGQEVPITAIMILISVWSQLMEPSTFANILSLSLFILGMVLIFKNSGISEHLG